MKTRLLFRSLAALVVTLAACSDTTGPVLPDFEGQYTVGGTINGFPISDITGSVSITNQIGTAATIVQTLNFRVSGQTIVTVFTESPATAELDLDGSISWSFFIEETTFAAAGDLAGNRISGTWNWTGSGEALAGSFAATR